MNQSCEMRLKKLNFFFIKNQYKVFDFKICLCVEKVFFKMGFKSCCISMMLKHNFIMEIATKLPENLGNELFTVEEVSSVHSSNNGDDNSRSQSILIIPLLELSRI